MVRVSSYPLVMTPPAPHHTHRDPHFAAIDCKVRAICAPLCGGGHAHDICALCREEKRRVQCSAGECSAVQSEK